MADAKISALTSVTTPLAGTEVLPIVQSSSTKKVTVDNLTKGRTVNATTFDTDVAAAGVTLSGVTLSADGTNTNIDINITPKGTGEVNITKVDIDGGSIDGTTIGAATAATGKFTDVSAAGEVSSTTNNARFSLYRDTGINYFDWASGQTLVFGTQTSSGGAGRVGKVSFLDSGNVSIANGNLIIGTAGKGIDFTQDPNPAGMTSELLDDYEEGTWTPTDASGAGLTIAITAGTTPTYVKIGRLVVCSADVTYPVTADATTARLSMPFSPSATNPSGGGVVGYKSDGIFSIGSTGSTGSVFLGPVNTFQTNANLSGVRFSMTWTFQV
jgi:hypothetical protein